MLTLLLKATQVEKYGLDPAGRHRKSTGNGRRNPLSGSGGRIYPVLPGTERNRANPATGSVQRIPASISRYFPAGNGVFPAGSFGIRRPESSTWDDNKKKLLRDTL